MSYNQPVCVECCPKKIKIDRDDIRRVQSKGLARVYIFVEWTDFYTLEEKNGTFYSSNPDAKLTGEVSFRSCMTNSFFTGEPSICDNCGTTQGGV